MKNLFLIFCLVFSSVVFSADRAPLSVQVITGSYTVPARKIAKVYVECDSGGVFTINGVNAVTTSGFVHIDQLAGTGAVASYTVPSNYIAIVSLHANPTTDFTPSGNTNAIVTVTPSSSINGLPIGPNGSIVSANTNTKSITGYATPSNATNRQANFTLPAGTVLNGTGSWRATVELYER